MSLYPSILREDPIMMSLLTSWRGVRDRCTVDVQLYLFDVQLYLFDIQLYLFDIQLLSNIFNKYYFWSCKC